MTAPAQLDEPGTDELVDRPWVTIVWNDPVNTFGYVTHVLMELFGYSRDKATELMLAVHHEGRAMVSTGTREQMEADVTRCHGRGLSATLQQD